MVSTLDTLASEYRTLTEGCGLVDRSGRGRLALTGADRRTFLHGQITHDIEGLEPGHGRYAALLTHKGKMLSDLRVLDLGDELLLSCERGGSRAPGSWGQRSTTTCGPGSAPTTRCSS